MAATVVCATNSNLFEYIIAAGNCLLVIGCLVVYLIAYKNRKNFNQIPYFLLIIVSLLLIRNVVMFVLKYYSLKLLNNCW